jgi:hypothetical protein
MDLEGNADSKITKILGMNKSYITTKEAKILT